MLGYEPVFRVRIRAGIYMNQCLELRPMLNYKPIFGDRARLLGLRAESLRLELSYSSSSTIQ